MSSYPVHPFQHLGKTWRLWKRSAAPDAPWVFTPPWGARGQKVWHTFRDKTTKAPLHLAAALEAARQLIDAHFRGPDQYQELRDATKLRDTLTVGAVLAQWDTAGCPMPNGIPRREPEQKRQRAHLRWLREWWNVHHVHKAAELHGQYARWRRAQVPAAGGYTGNRSLELEFTTLRNCFRWALRERIVKINPFTDSERYVDTRAIIHCNTYMPASPEEFHRIIRALLAHDSPLHRVAGAQLCYMGLTGARAGEPGFLKWDAKYTAGGLPEPGHIFPRQLDGRASELLAIERLKNGINPAIEMRPALASFLSVWKPYCRHHWPDSPWWFPDPLKPSEPLHLPQDRRNRLRTPLNQAVAALALPERHPHGMRAYYVRVRRSQGASDATIADELGESTGAAIIVSTYGRADQIRGDGRFDFLPAEGAPAWTQLTLPPTNVIAL